MIEFEFNTLGSLGETIADLNNSAGIDGLSYFELLDWAALEQRERWRMYSVLEGFAGAVKDMPSRIYSFFHTMNNHISDSNAYHLRRGFEAWIETNNVQLNELTKLFEKGEHDSPFLGSLLRSWHKIEPVEALDSALRFSGDSRPAMRRQAILALGSFDFHAKPQEAHTENRLIELALSDETDLQCVAIAAIAQRLGKQSVKSPLLVSALVSIAEQPSHAVRQELIAGFVNHASAYPEPLRSKVIDLMKRVQTDCLGALDLIDLALNDMDVDKDRETIFDVLTALISQESGAPNFDTLDSTSHKLQNAEHEVLCWYMTHWLLEGEYSVCSQLGSLFPPLTTDCYKFDLSSFDLSIDEVFYLTRKIYVYLMFSHGPAVSLLCECLFKLPLVHRKQLERDIAAFWLQNFPGDLEIFEVSSETHIRKGLNASIKRIKKLVDAYQTPLKALPKNVALHPSAMERRIQSELQNERSKQVARTAEENSVFGSLFHKSTLLYGRSSVTYIYPSGATEPVRTVIPMQSIETSSPLPRMDCLYPARLNYLLFRFRREKRPK